MKFSLLVAQYNNGKYFKECFQSITNQTEKEFEVIILDDCSTDGSLEIITNLTQNDNRFKIYHNKKNEGCGFTKKKLIELATGTICGFLDPDDSLHPDAIKLSLEKYQENKKTVGTYSQFMLCDENLKPIKLHLNSKQISPNQNDFFNEEINISHFFTFKKEVYQKTEGINPYYKIAEDMDLILKIYEQGILVFIDEPLYNYRLHAEGVSSHQFNKIRAKFWFAIVLYEAHKRRKLPLDVDRILMNTIGITEIKYRFSQTFIYKSLFRIYNKLFL